MLLKYAIYINAFMSCGWSKSANVTDDTQTDRQTDHATEKCVEISRIVCAARAIPHKNCNKML